MMVFENSLIYFPMNFPEDDWSPRGIVLEDAWFAAADGTKIHGWYVPHETPRAVVLFCHGNAGNITHRADVIRALHDRVGAAVLIFDYRGYGKSEGKPDEPACWPTPGRPALGLPRRPAWPRTGSCSWASRWAGPWRSIWPPTGPGR